MGRRKVCSGRKKQRCTEYQNPAADIGVNKSQSRKSSLRSSDTLNSTLGASKRAESTKDKLEISSASIDSAESADSSMDSPELTDSSIDSAELTNSTKNNKKRKRGKSGRTYNEVMLQKALDAVKEGMLVSTAAKLYDIPRSTLSGKINGTLPPSLKNRGPECILGDEYEQHLLQWILCMSQNGFPVSRVQILDSVQLVLNHEKKKTVFKDNRPGRNWYNAFCTRHAEISQQMSQNLLHSRASVTEQKLRAWFDEVRLYLESRQLLDIHPSRVFNCDESALLLSPTENKVLVRKGDKGMYNFIKNDEKECLTTLFCGNADGSLAPSMVVYPYKRIPGHIAANMPNEWGIGHSENGWMTGETFYEYVANIFHPWLLKNSIIFPVILFLDGHSSYLTMALSDFCRENHIEIVALYPNATHILQPLDIAFFHPLKTAWAKAVREFRLENNADRIQREQFAQLLQSAVESLDVKQILTDGFKNTGIHPFSANSISYHKYFKDLVESEPIQEKAHSESSEMEKAALVLLEGSIEKELLQRFKDSEDEEWNGETKHESLFNVWREIRRKSIVNEISDARKQAVEIIRYNIF